MRAQQGGDERRRVVGGGLDGVHVGAREGGGVLALVVERVHVLVEEAADVREALDAPRVHGAVDDPEVRHAHVRDGHGPQERGEVVGGERRLERQVP